MYGNPPPPPYGPPSTVIVQKKGHGCLWAMIGAGALFTLLVGFVIIVAVANSGGGSSSTGSSSTGSNDADRVARIGDVVEDGKFAFKVTKVETGLPQVGTGLTASKAQGQYIVVHLTVTNIGDRAQTFHDGAQKLIDAKGREYSADTGAAIWLEGSNSFLKEINPGNSVTGFLLFDVPKNVDLRAVELHDSIFSGGVTVALTPKTRTGSAS